jgi:hypothetical protein
MAGFHNDKKLQNVVDFLSESSDVFIETGTNIGNTLYYMVSNHKHLQCFSCEPDINKYKKAASRLKNFKNSHIFNTTSQKFLPIFLNKYSKVLNKKLIVWLDAHSKLFSWPLKDEIQFFTKRCKSCAILIDDFKVPTQKQFRFNKHKKQPYSFEYIQRFIDPICSYDVYYPKYKKTTNDKLTGWVLLDIGKQFKNLNKRFKETLFIG